MDPIREVKVRAELLHKRLRASDPVARERLRALPEYKRANDDALRAAAAEVQRKHCLAAVSRELGFTSFDHAVRVLDGAATEGEATENQDFGKLLATGGGAHLNLWYATYEEARAAHAEVSTPASRRYLLAYARHFFVADRHFIEALSLDPDDPDWEAIGWDWARPRSHEARRRLYCRAIEAR
jgi:hypothetical protein